ncbi:anthranilate synthase component 2/para-aminobenzoate synthetase component 2 [Halanaerobium saccharolyticum]|uniref:Anthranilate synthase component 2/para-aminobenzoate synthetase component 2 n=1 Tax=Halanaerobium saccharolyticum TaxID=43595 RepID=A0A4R7ZBN3_9FIRM|nr:anthranilate synthase component 2/para-aminobenzoate synthetase component 2 [Halanaerobium saccharolyticum]TDW07736.1 anthranilate synthase component 2/para-aminobenzoate synthetase component 2 [Halanaerobium saccharolyticum]TDX64657.1 anthranilate synthase component 2/para-aminobenzoate synthetase component 2 [Halanaerobium saccharolyticum]
MILVIDNYDSFTYNLVHLLEEFDQVKVMRNDKLSLDDVEIMAPDKIIISPGPGRPDDAGISKELIEYFKDKIDILGVCLGHQCIGEVFGSRVVEADRIVHGKVAAVRKVRDDSLFAGIDDGFAATRYHSLIVDRESLGSELEVLAESDQGEIMALKHKNYSVYGVQFHPESILTEVGRELIKNFLEL